MSVELNKDIMFISFELICKYGVLILFTFFIFGGKNSTYVNFMQNFTYLLNQANVMYTGICFVYIMHTISFI